MTALSTEKGSLARKFERPITPVGADTVRDDAETLDAQAAKLRSQRMTYREIAEVQKCSVATAHERAQRGLQWIMYEDVDTGRQFERARLDLLWTKVWDIAMREHTAVAHGKVVKDDEGNPIIDDSQNLQALRELRAIGESYRKLEGLDQPTRVEQSGSMVYRIEGVDPAEDLT